MNDIQKSLEDADTHHNKIQNQLEEYGSQLESEKENCHKLKVKAQERQERVATVLGAAWGAIKGTVNFEYGAALTTLIYTSFAPYFWLKAIEQQLRKGEIKMHSNFEEKFGALANATTNLAI